MDDDAESETTDDTDGTERADHASVDASPPRSVSSTEWEQRVVEAGRTLHRGRVELLTALAPFDLDGRWAFTGAPTCAHWVADRLGVSLGTARDWLRVARALADLPEVASAFARGDLSYAAVRTLTRIAVDHPEHQDELVGLVSGVPCDEVARVLAGWCREHEDADTSERRHRRETSLTIRCRPDGMGTLTLHAPMVDVGRVHAAIDARVRQGGLLEAGTRAGLGRQRALALVDLLTNAAGASVDTEVIVHVRGDGCTLHDGTPLTDHTVAGLLDTAFVRALIHDAEDHPIDASGRQRHPNIRQCRVVDERQPVCVDCGSRDLLEYDHDPEYSVSGRTLVDELSRRCAPCHRRRHRASGAGG